MIHPDDMPPFPLTHENLDAAEAEILAHIEAANEAHWTPAGMPLWAVIRTVDLDLLEMLDWWRRALLAQEATQNAKKPPTPGRGGRRTGGNGT